jgi:hypothetical protein
LHRGDERAYATLLLQALRQLLTTGFQASTTKLDLENLEEFLVQQLFSPSLVTSTVQLYRECTELSFHPTNTQHQPDSEKDYARFLAARRIFDQLLAQLPPPAKSKKN